MKKTVALILTLALLCSLLQGCRMKPPLPTEPASSAASEQTAPAASTVPASSELPVTTAEPETTEPETTEPPAPDEALIRWQNGGYRDYLGDLPVDMVRFSDMEYARPDVEKMYAQFDALIARAEKDEPAAELLPDYYAVYDEYISFYTMDTLANVRYSIDTTDSFYKQEYDFCEAEKPNVEEKLEALYKAFAACGSRDALEKEYFGEGYFLKYDDYEVYTNETYLRLSQQEEEIKAQYRSLLEDPTVEIDGEERSFWEILDTDDYFTYFKGLKAYYEKYNALIGELYVKLVKLRRQLAAALDYDSYSDYSYDVSYQRDYSPEQGRAFTEEIRELLVPVYRDAAANEALTRLSQTSASEKQVRAMVESAAERIGGTVADAFRFMQTYELFDITKSAKKTDSSFQTYIYAYEAPFVLVNSQGSSDDYTTFAHEFGHFSDSYYNYGANEDLETAETYSQSMEFLALRYTGTLNELQKTKLIKMKLLDLLQTFITQAAYSSFEQRVFDLPEKELTVENINGVYRQVCKDFGFYESGFDFYYSQSWIDVMHFFEVPDYVISYCVSADTSLQVYQLEAEKEGEGVAAFFRLLDRDQNAGVQQVMEDAGLSNPFRKGCLRETAEFFRAQLGLDGKKGN